MSINAIAINGDVKPSTLQSFINGSSNNPTVKIIEGVSDGLGISVKDFFDFEPYNLNPDQKTDIHQKTPDEILDQYGISPDQLEDILKIVKKKTS
ncbi:helix-turn-helix domain-containing protein [Enterococcus plantarum]|uniref:helix-turn-helix domain-containing protein n=1 Tax=Enterococcus plantarum TaxID=1077675 RepID=UPI001A8D2B00|nr:helix-turn-helix domain-containing protein [Enterococcus plantarum]